MEQYYFERKEFDVSGGSMQVQMDLMLHMTHENACHNDFTIKNIVEDIRERAEECHNQKALQLWRDLHTTIKPEELWGLCHCCQQGVIFRVILGAELWTF